MKRSLYYSLIDEKNSDGFDSTFKSYYKELEPGDVLDMFISVDFIDDISFQVVTDSSELITAKVAISNMKTADIASGLDYHGGEIVYEPFLQAILSSYTSIVHPAGTYQSSYINANQLNGSIIKLSVEVDAGASGNVKVYKMIAVGKSI